MPKTIYLEKNISHFKNLNHIEIADKIFACKELITYTTKNDTDCIKLERIKKIVKEFFIDKKQTFRIFGHNDYISDTYQWNN